MRKLFASALAVVALATTAPVMAQSADARATAFRAEQLEHSANALADIAYSHGRSVLANKAIAVAADSAALARTAWTASRGGRGDREIRASFQYVRQSFQDLRARWLDIRDNVRDPNLRYAWQGVQADFQNLRLEVRD